MKPAPMTDEQILRIVPGLLDCLADPYDKDGNGDYYSSIPHDMVRLAKAIIAARDAQWEQMLNKTQDLYTSKQPVQNSQEFIHDPAEIRRVFEIDDAERPDPDTGFALL